MVQKRRGPPSRSISRQNRGEIFFLRSIGDKNVDSKNMTLGLYMTLVQNPLPNSMTQLWTPSWPCDPQLWRHGYPQVYVYYLKRIKTESLSPHKVRGDMKIYENNKKKYIYIYIYIYKKNCKLSPRITYK